MSFFRKLWKKFKKSVKAFFSAAGDLLDSALDGIMGLFGLEGDGPTEDFGGTLITKTGSVQLLPVVYGERTVGGVWVFTEVTGSSNDFLWMVFALCDADSPINAIPEIFVNDVLHDDAKYSGLVVVETTLGDHTTQPFPTLESESDGKWTASHLLLGTAAVAVRLKWDQDVWSGIPRFTFKIQGSKIIDLPAIDGNLLTRSEEFDHADWVKGSQTIIANDAVAPDGTTTADRATSTATSGQSTLAQNSVSSAEFVSLTSYVKDGTITWVEHVIWNGSDVLRQWFNVATGELGTSSAIGTPLVTKVTAEISGPDAQGFYRLFTVAFNPNLLSLNCRPFQLAGADGVSSSDTDTLFCWAWGAQLIEGSHIPIYYKTEGSSKAPATRVYSANPAEILFDYMTNPIYGKGLSIFDGVDLDIQSFIDSRSHANDSINSFSGGPAHTRMECNMVLQSGVKIMDNIKNILQSCRGTLPYINGIFYLVIEKHYEPADYFPPIFNLLTQPEDFSHADWVKQNSPTIVTNADTAPDGTLTADTIEDSSAVIHEYIIQDTASYTVSSFYCVSVYVKKDSIGRTTRSMLVRIRFYGSTAETNHIALDTLTGETNTEFNSTPGISGIESIGDYWRIFVAAKSIDGSNTSADARIVPAQSNDIDWSSQISAVGTITVWGAQVTPGNSLQPYFHKYFDFNVDNVIGSWSFISGDVNSRYNRVKVTFPNEDLEHKPDEVIVESSTFRMEDKRLLEKSIALKGTTNVYRAIDTASILMRRSRQQIQTSFMATPAALQVRAGTVVTITHPTPGWDLKQFRVSKIKLLSTGNCKVNLTEHDSTVYDLTLPNEVSTSPDTNLPDPTAVPGITGVSAISDETVLKTAVDGTLITQLYITWDIPSNIFVNGYDVEYKLSSESIWLPAGSPNSIGSNEIYIQNVVELTDYDFRVRAKNSGGFVGAWNTIFAHNIIGKTSKPGDVTGLINSVIKSGVELSWDSNTDLDIFDYEIRSGGTDWDSALFVGRTDGTKFPIGLLASGSFTYRIKARDTGKRESVNDLTTIVTISDPVGPVVSHFIDNDAVVLTWSKPSSAFTIVAYTLSYTHPTEGIEQLGNVDTTTLRFKVDWGGTATFHVSAIDLAGNSGPEGDEMVTIQSPKRGFVSVSVIDNNVLLNWPDMADTLPIKAYELRKGAIYGTSSFIAFQEGTFAALFEDSAGLFTYWVTGKDTAGVLGFNNSITAQVNEPPDFILHDNQNIDLSTGVKTNVFFNGNSFLNFGVNLTETWEDHFNVNNSFADIQDQIDAGYPVYIQPTFNYLDTITDISSKQCTVTSTTGLSTGFKVRISDLAEGPEEDLYNVASVDDSTHFTVTEAITDEASATATVKSGSRWATDAIDYGIILSNLSITINITGAVIAGDPTVRVRIRISEDDISYTNFQWNKNVVFAESFRYVKVEVDVDGDTGDDLYELNVFNIVISIKEKTEAGSVNITSLGGTTVTFLKTWIDISSIVLAAGVDGSGQAALTPIYDFADDPNPTTMDVYLYDNDGTELDAGTVSWNIRGH